MEVISEDLIITVKGSKSVTVNGNGPVFVYSNSMIIKAGKNTNKLFPSDLPSKTYEDIMLVINGNGPIFMHSKGSITINGDGFVSKL